MESMGSRLLLRHFRRSLILGKLKSTTSDRDVFVSASVSSDRAARTGSAASIKESAHAHLSGAGPAPIAERMAYSESMNAVLGPVEQ